MTGLEMFFWIVAAVLTAYALIKWWERTTAAAKEAQEERLYDEKCAREDAGMRKLLGMAPLALKHLHSGPLQELAVDFTGDAGLMVQCFDDSFRISVFNARGPKPDANGEVDIFAAEHTKVVDTTVRELSDGDLLAVFLNVVGAPPILGAADVDNLMDGWRYRYSESVLKQISAMAAEIQRRNLLTARHA
jgi:hypothetical protein